MSTFRSEDTSYEIKESAKTFDVLVPRSAAVKTLGSASLREPIDWVKVASDCKEIRSDPSIVSCEPNVIRKTFIVPNDSLFSYQWGLRDTTGNDADIRAHIAWNRGVGTKSTLIGVIDSGIYSSHPDLANNLWLNPGEPADGVDNDGNGYVDDLFGVNTAFGHNDPYDCFGHGTHVSGIIGAQANNGRGVAGVNWTTSLIAASTEEGDCGGGSSLSTILKAYDYFHGLKRLGHNIRVINASFGGTAYSSAEYNAIRRLASVDILVVAAAGNEDMNIDFHPSYPASYELPNIVAVGATGPSLSSTGYTNYGQSVDIAAPGGISADSGGGGIMSTYSPRAPGALYYEELSGTSMAAPMVTGALGLLASQRPYLTGSHLKNILFEAADRISGNARYVAQGRYLNLGAMSLAADPADNCPADPNKLEPGACGCGIPDSYRDGDNDATLDCLDQCPSDRAKTTRGGCGCGVADVDANANAVVDCKDPVVANVIPPSPVVKATKKFVSVTMTRKGGITYYLKVTVQSKSKGRAKTKTTYYTSKTPIAKLPKVASGSTLSVSYAYRLEGTPVLLSRYSRVRRVRVK